MLAVVQAVVVLLAVWWGGVLVGCPAASTPTRTPRRWRALGSAGHGSVMVVAGWEWALRRSAGLLHAAHLFPVRRWCSSYCRGLSRASPEPHLFPFFLQANEAAIKFARKYAKVQGERWGRGLQVCDVSVIGQLMTSVWEGQLGAAAFSSRSGGWGWALTRLAAPSLARTAWRQRADCHLGAAPAVLPAACSRAGPLQRRHRVGLRHRGCVLHRLLPRPHHGLAGAHVQGRGSRRGWAGLNWAGLCGAVLAACERQLEPAEPSPPRGAVRDARPPTCACPAVPPCLQDQYRTPFQPVMPGNVMVPYM